MSRPRSLQQLKDVLEIRAAQRHATEARLRDARSALSGLLNAQEAAQDTAFRAQASWFACTNNRLLPLPLALAWGREIVAVEAELERVKDRVRRAERVEAERLAAHRAAEARQDAARSMAKAVHRRIARKGEDAATTALEERLAASWGPR